MYCQPWAPRPVSTRCSIGQHDHLGADIDAAVEVDDVFVDQADATRRHLSTDGRGSVGAVDAVDGAAEIHGAGAERVLRAAGHEARQIGLALHHFRGRRPIRPLGLARDGLGARPGEAFAADADAVADRLAVAEHVIEIGVGRIDDHRAGGLAGRVFDDLAAEAVGLLDVVVGVLRDCRSLRKRKRLAERKQSISGSCGGEEGGGERRGDAKAANG